MKKIALLFLFKSVFFQNAFSQNIGIGNTLPLAKLDVNGDIAVRSADLTIATTYNYALDVNIIKQSSYKLKAPAGLGNFIIAGITSGVDGRIITLSNRTGSPMEIYHEDLAATAANRIQTGTGSTIAVYNNGNVTLQYDGADQRWVIKALHNNSLNYFGGGGGGTSSWDIVGNNISNNNAGNVGIGNASPLYKFDVAGQGRFRSTFLSQGTGGFLTNGGALFVTNSADGYSVAMDGGKIQAERPVGIGSSGSFASILALNPYGGNVGIGLTNPAARLTILSNTVETNNNTYVLQVAGKNPMINFTEYNGTPYAYIKGVTDRSITPQFPSPGLEIGGVPGADVFLSANYSPVLTISHNNSVGIGTTNPDPAYKLSVSGHIRAKEIRVNTNWADYVFNVDYRLMPLNEVESFINKNKHLPGVPAAAALQAEGMDVSKMQTTMMEKIEELTLYLIEANRRIEDLQKENAVIKNKIKL